MPTIHGDALYKTGSVATPAVGDYYMLQSGLWIRAEAGGLWSGPYKTTDGAAFSEVVGGAQITSVPGRLLLDWASLGTLTLASANGAPEAVALDTSVTYNGYSTARCTLKASTTFIGSIDQSTQPNVGVLRTIQIPIRFSSNVGFVDGSNAIQIWMYNNGLAKQFRLQGQISTLQSGQWHILSFQAGAAQEGWTFAGGAANSSEMAVETLQRFRIVVAAPAGSDSVQCWVGPLFVNSGKRGCVSIVCDGEYISQQNYVLPMLNGYGLKASLALTHSLIGSSASYMTAAQVTAAASAGHELIHHTFDNTKTNGYANSTDWPTAAAITADISAGFANIRTLAGANYPVGYCVHGYSNPFDQTVTQVRQDLVSGAFSAASVKTIRKSTAIYRRMQNPVSVNPYLVQGAIQITAAQPAMTLSLAADTGSGIVFTAGSAQFSTADVGKEIYAGTGTAYAVITAAGTTGALQTTCTVDITGTFSATSFTSGNWTLADGSRTLQTVIDLAEANGEWAVITIHRAVVDSSFPAALEQRVTVMDTWMRYLANRVRLGGIDCFPFGRASRAYGVSG